MKKTALIYWLRPADPFRDFFRELIGILANQLDAPRFEPHLTLGQAKDPALVRKVTAAPFTLDVRATASSSKFTKTLFVRFRSNESLADLATSLQVKAVRDPHLSLLYKKISPGIMKELAATIQLPFREVVFDTIQIVRCPLPTEDRRDVENWRTVATKRLR